jgi:drug/metabolite transporter (DMT)-like permease
MTMCLPSILKAYGFKYLVSSKAALIGSLDPFITSLYAYLLWGETLTVKKFIGMIIAFSGILFLITSTSPIEAKLGEWWIVSLPELAMFASMAMSRLGWIMARQLLRSERYTPSELNSINMLISGVFALILTYFFGVCDFCTIPPTVQFAALFSYSVLVGDILCYNIYGYFLKKYDIILLSLCGLSTPLFVHLLGPLLHHEPITAHFFIALGLVTLGTYIFYRNKLTKSPA